MRIARVHVVVASIAFVGLLGLYFVSSWTAESGCVAVAERRGHTQVSYSWPWWPLGTECIFDRETSQTRLFW